jgi:hypothetical protein
MEGTTGGSDRRLEGSETRELLLQVEAMAAAVWCGSTVPGVNAS